MASSGTTGPLGQLGRSSVEPGGHSALNALNAGGLSFLKGLSETKLTRDGQPAKRRGPKPDSRPALTRRQELNRQAQRTHRERKELYIKALEDEVLRLKEIYSNVSQDRERLAEENRQLWELLAQGGNAAAAAAIISSNTGNPVSFPAVDDSSSNPSTRYAGTRTGSFAQPPSSQTSRYTPPPLSAASGQQHGSTSPHRQPGGCQPPQTHALAPAQGQALPQRQGQAETPQRNPGMDYEQIGIDFVLTLEKPCMAHIPMLQERGVDGEPCGHALMASCPPEQLPNLTPEIPFGYSNVPNSSHGGLESARGGNYGHETDMPAQRTWELSRGDLSTLLDLSSRLNLDGEITPVMAWGMVLAHPRLSELTMTDFQRLTDDLSGKIRCYGFGAVMEDFEARDAIENVFSTKPDLIAPGFAFAY